MSARAEIRWRDVRHSGDIKELITPRHCYLYVGLTRSEARLFEDGYAV